MKGKSRRPGKDVIAGKSPEPVSCASVGGKRAKPHRHWLMSAGRYLKQSSASSGKALPLAKGASVK